MARTLEQIDADILACKLERSDIETTRRAEIFAAEQAIKAKFEPLLSPISERHNALARERAAVMDATADHPWTGKRVVMVTAARRSWLTPTTTYGIVEMRRSDTRFAENLSNWRLPTMAKPFVRALKKDGTPGTKIAAKWLSDDWKLADDDDEKAAQNDPSTTREHANAGE